jgi:hypothetical protein
VIFKGSVFKHVEFPIDISRKQVLSLFTSHVLDRI